MTRRAYFPAIPCSIYNPPAELSNFEEDGRCRLASSEFVKGGFATEKSVSATSDLSSEMAREIEKKDRRSGNSRRGKMKEMYRVTKVNNLISECEV